MTVLRTFTAALAVLALPLAAAPAQAQEWPSPEQLARAFKAICVDNAGDQKAQIKTATSAPWNMKRSDDSTAERAYFDAKPWQLAVSNVDGIEMCSITTGTAAGTTDAQARTAAIKVLGPKPAELETIELGFAWSPRIGNRQYEMMYQQETYQNNGNPLTVASYMVGYAK